MVYLLINFSLAYYFVDIQTAVCPKNIPVRPCLLEYEAPSSTSELGCVRGFELEGGDSCQLHASLDVSRTYLSQHIVCESYEMIRWSGMAFGFGIGAPVALPVSVP